MTINNLYYHYTSISTLEKIITSKKVWFTDYRFLNDGHEIKHGLNKLLDNFPNERELFMDAFKLHNCQTNYCIFSMSESHEILTQWREYAEDGSGVAIGFNKQFMNNAGIELVKCNYNVNDVNDVNEELIKKHSNFIKAVAKNTKHDNNNSMGKIQSWIKENKEQFEACIEDTMYMKNNAFKNEQEIRAVIAVPTNEMKFRVSGELMIPYAEIALWGEEAPEFNHDSVNISNVINEIWLGPKANCLNKTAINMLNIKYLQIEKYDCGYI